MSLVSSHCFVVSNQVKVNRMTLEIFGYQFKEEILGENVSVLVGGKDAEHHDAYVQNFHKNNKESTQIGKQRVLFAKRKDGSQFPCIVGIKRSTNRKYIVGYIRDMSGLAEPGGKGLTEANLQAVSAVNKVVDDASFDSIIVIDKRGLIQNVNETTLEDFGYDSKEELLGRNVSILVGGGMDHHKHDEHVHKFHESGKTSRVLRSQRLLKSKRKDGSEFRCMIGLHTIQNTDFVAGYIRNVESLLAEVKKEL